MSWADVAGIPAGWGPANEVSVTTLASTDVQDLVDYIDDHIYLFWLPDSKGAGHSCHVRWGDSSLGAAALTDLPLTEEHPFRVVRVTRDYHAFRAISAGGDGSLFWAVSTR